MAFLPAGLGLPGLSPILSQASSAPSHDFHLHPHYRTQRELDDVLRKVQPGFDDFLTEKYHAQIAGILKEWSAQLRTSPLKTEALEKAMTPNFEASSPKASSSQVIRDGASIKVWRMKFAGDTLIVQLFNKKYVSFELDLEEALSR